MMQPKTSCIHQKSDPNFITLKTHKHDIYIYIYKNSSQENALISTKSEVIDMMNVFQKQTIFIYYNTQKKKIGDKKGN